MVTRAHWLTIALCGVVACGSEPKKELFQRLAREARPHIQELEPFAQKVIRLEGIDPSIDAMIVDACRAPNRQLEALKAINFRADDANPPIGYSVNERAGLLLEEQTLYCDKLRDPRACVQFCIREWTELALAIEHFRGDAAAYGVSVRGFFY
jgi:hypothetical protein